MPNNGDTHRTFTPGQIRGLGSFHKTLRHNKWGEVREADFIKLVAAAEGNGTTFGMVPPGSTNPNPKATAPLTNPQAGLADDQLTHHPASYSMPPAPSVLSTTTAAEMTELYWMALLRDVAFDKFATDPGVAMAATEIQGKFQLAVDDIEAGHLQTGSDVPGAEGVLAPITPQNLFRLGLPGEEFGPLISQFFLRNAGYGTQKIDQQQRPYVRDKNYLTAFPDWLRAQRSGRDGNISPRDPFGQDYSHANENSAANFATAPRYIATPRDLARFVNKDALHQAYFNAALILLNGGAKWTPGNPYSDTGPLPPREAGFGTLGGPHILALVSEVATRALKVVWNQKWQVHLRLRPEAYGGHVHVQKIGIRNGGTRAYGLPPWVATSTAAGEVKKMCGTLLLPMAFTPGSPNHPAYGAGHATVAGACVTVLKAFFETIDDAGNPIRFIYHKTTNPKGLRERSEPFGDGIAIPTFNSGVVKHATNPMGDTGILTPLLPAEAQPLTIEGELNKLAMNVAMGRSMGGVHWRTDNTRSLRLGEALAAQILAEITTDCNERPIFTFRSFSRRSDGKPKTIRIRQGRVYVDDVLVDTHSSAL
jgi:hypothetical protein